LDNRGVGNTTLGTANFTIDQFVKDTVGLLNTLNISKTDVLGFSMGGMIAQQLTINYSAKVDDLIIYASTCGGKLSTLAKPEVLRVLLDKSGNDTDKRNRWIPLQLTKWIVQYPNYNEMFKNITYPPNEILELQDKAIFDWFEVGVCERLKGISHDTLVITGTGDRVIPPSNSLILEKVLNASLVKIEDGGHKVMFQFLDRFSSDVIKFLKN
jgi:pimeloyl-ACP methyl ester carboxylesterase